MGRRVGLDERLAAQERAMFPPEVLDPWKSRVELTLGARWRASIWPMGHPSAPVGYVVECRPDIGRVQDVECLVRLSSVDADEVLEAARLVERAVVG